MLRFAKLSSRWLTNFGMTLSIGDVTPEQSLVDYKQKLILERFERCTDFIKKYESKELRVKPGCTAESTLEDEVSALLNEIRDEAGKYCFSHLPSTNSALKMAICGSKGSNLNLCQMIACVGQQIVSGKRVSNGFTYRTLPHFKENSKEPKARGFVQNSFFDGLTPNEFFFHTMAGREGLIDTAVKSVTPETKVFLLEDGAPRCVEIGPWIDGQLARRAAEVEHFAEQEMELLQLAAPVFIPTADAHGRVTWGAVTAITRHNPGLQLFAVKTASGRSVVVTESKSLLIYDEATHTFERMASAEVRPGHQVPVTLALCAPPVLLESLRLPADRPGTPEAFPLNRATGLLLGLLLAADSPDFGPDCISLAHSSPVLLAEVAAGLAQARLSETAGVAQLAILSPRLARFLGTLTQQGTLLPEALPVAPLEHIVGFLAAYCSSKSSQTADGLNILARDESMADALNMLLSRLGVFASSRPCDGGHLLEVRGGFAAALEAALGSAQPVSGAASAGWARSQNDVVLDEIVEISPVDVRGCPKVYDLTVPSTLNFGLASGLHVVDTADTGYMQRRLIKAMEDIVVFYDSSVRNSEGNIIQFIYGDDGLDPVHIEEFTDFPIDVERLIRYAISFYPKKPSYFGMNPKQLIDVASSHIDSLAADPDVFIVDRYVQYLRDYFAKYSERVREYFKETEKDCFSVSIGVTKQQLDFFFEKLKQKLIRARISAGDGVGATTAQSIGEPCTQMTLKTFHFAGVASMNVTLGVPRIKEIINASTNIQTPIIEVFLRNSSDIMVAKLVKNTINPILIENIAEYIKEVYEPTGCYLELKLDINLIKSKLLNVTIQKVEECILKAKLKLKPKHVTVMSKSKIRIESFDSSERDMIFILKSLKNRIRKIKCGGVGNIKRALISYNQDDQEKDYKVFAEG